MESTITAKPCSNQGKKKPRRRGPRLTGVSRQRRMANARERCRVQTLNAHIERLRDLIPLFPGEKKPSKTETIRLAAVYISCLTDILETTPEGLERIATEELIPTFPSLDDNLSLAGLPKLLFEPFSDNEGIHLDFFTHSIIVGRGSVSSAQVSGRSGNLTYLILYFKIISVEGEFQLLLRNFHHKYSMNSEEGNF